MSWPKGNWARQQLKSRNLPQSLVALMREIQVEKKYLVRLITRGGSSISPIRLYIMPENKVAEFGSADDVEAALREWRAQKNLNAPWADNDKQIFICCTNGNRDRCCAKYGYAVVKELERLRDLGVHDLEVWQSTHLTGDRFAGTGIALPSGDMYGWLRKENVQALLEALENDAPSALFRGNCYLSERNQVAHAAINEYLHRKNLRYRDTALQVTWAVRPEDSQVQEAMVALSDAPTGQKIGEGRILLTRRTFGVYADCQDSDEDRAMNVPRLIVDEVTWRESETG